LSRSAETQTDTAWDWEPNAGNDSGHDCHPYSAQKEKDSSSACLSSDWRQKRSLKLWIVCDAPLIIKSLNHVRSILISCHWRVISRENRQQTVTDFYFVSLICFIIATTTIMNFLPINCFSLIPINEIVCVCPVFSVVTETLDSISETASH
jgi:hypothetical protein